MLVCDLMHSVLFLAPNNNTTILNWRSLHDLIYSIDLDQKDFLGILIVEVSSSPLSHLMAPPLPQSSNGMGLSQM